MKTKLLPILMILMLACLSATGPKSNATIGKIGDRTFTYDEYNRILENYFNHHSGGKSQTLSPEEKARLNNQCWEEQIGRYIYDTEIKRRKLRITDAELERETLRNPPEAIKQIADLQTNNRFDPDKLRLALETNPDFKRNALDFVKQTYQYKKLFEAIRSAVKADADSVRREWTLQNDTADARIIHFDYNRLTNILASDDEIREYYETNIADYRKENGRTYRYFRFSKSPSPQDSLFTKNLADSLYVNLKEGGDFAEAAQQYSKDPGSALRGGDLGFFGRGRMVKPFEDAAFSTPVGEISAPVESRFGWHIIKVIDKRVDSNGRDEVQASHILLKPEISESALKQIKVDSEKLFSTAWITGLVPAAALLDYELSETEAFTQTDRAIPPMGTDPNLVGFAFANPVGTLHGLHTASNGDIYILEIADSLEVFYTPLERDIDNIRNLVTTRKRVDSMRDYANSFYTNYSPAEYFDRARQDTLVVVEAKAIKKGASIPSIGRIDILVDAILAAQTGDFTSLLPNANHWYLAEVQKRHKPDMKQWEKERSQLITKATEELQQQHLNRWYFEEKQKLTIEDKRKDFYDLSPGRQN